MKSLNEKTSSILKLTQILQNSYNSNEHKNIILPLIILKRLDSLLNFSKQDVLTYYNQHIEDSDLKDILKNKSLNENKKVLGFYNTSENEFNSLIENPDNLKRNIIEYTNCFSENIKEIFEYFNFSQIINHLSKTNLLLQFIEELSKIDLSTETVSNKEMGEIFDELLIEFSKSNQYSGEFFTPKDINSLMATLLLTDNNKKTVKIYDPTCGSGGTLTTCEDMLDNNVSLYGQELNPQNYALCKSNLLMRGDSFENIKGPANTLTEDQFKDEKFDYIVSQPPFGASWGDDYKIIVEEYKNPEGRFKAGLPRKHDNQLLFIQHMISKMKTESKSKIAVITSGLPLFIGESGSGESEIRKWLIENDYIETIIELPPQLFHYTSINTYLWILTNKKSDKRKGKVQLINAKDIIPQTSKKLSSKKYKVTNNAIKIILSYYKNFTENDKCIIFDNDEFSYLKMIPSSSKVKLDESGGTISYFKSPRKKDTSYKIDFNKLNFDKEEFFNNIDYPIFDLGDIVKLEKSREITREYDFYIEPITNNTKSGKVIYYPHELQKTQLTQIGCKISNNNVEKEYLYYFLNSNQGLELISNFKKIITSTIHDFSQIPIPVPDNETQKEIIKTYKLMESFFKDMELWKNNYLNNILDYKTTLESYKEFSCSINFGDDGGVKDFCRNWRIVYQGLIWPLAYTYLKATKGSKDESTMKKNYLVLFEFIAAFNVIVLISAIKESDIEDEELKEINNNLWQLFKDNERTWHRMHFGSWTTLYSRLTKIFKNEDYEFLTPINREFLNQLSQKKYNKLFNKIRNKERNPEAHGGLEDSIDVKIKLEDLKIYLENDIYDILNLYSGLKLYYITENRKQISPRKIEYEVMALNGPCDPPNWNYLTTNEKLEPFSLYLYDSLSNSYLKLDNDLIRLYQITNSKQWGIYIYDSADMNKKVTKYKCYQHSQESKELTLNTEEDTYFKVSGSFLKDVLRL